MEEEERVAITAEEVFEEARKYSSSQRRELIEDLETDIQSLAQRRSISNIWRSG